MEIHRKKQYAEQREVAKAKNQEQRIKASERRKLEEEEHSLRKKEVHLENSMRRYMTLRIRPLGVDRFYNRYIYLDNVGVANTCGSGRLYVQSPSDGDIQMMMERDYMKDLPEQACGYGGGRWFIIKLMQEQGCKEESAWLGRRMDELNTGHASEYRGWWKYYSDPEEVRLFTMAS
jgi:bromodomain adjacent to zinc finger domain protein 1A